MDVTATSRWQISPWAIFDDDGMELLVVNAFHSNSNPRVFSDREGLSAILDPGSRDGGNSSPTLIADLKKMGVLRGSDQPILPEPHATSGEPLVPFLRRIALTVVVSASWKRQASELALLCQRYAVAHAEWNVALQIREPEHVERADKFTAELLSLLARAGLDRARIDWQLRLSCLPDGDALPRLLDNWPDLHLVVEDRNEVLRSSDRSDQWARAEGLAKRGFLLRPVLLSRCGEDLITAVNGWQQVSDRAGVLVEPLFTDSINGTAVTPLESQEEFSSATEVMALVARALRTSVLQSEPWSSILTNAAIPGNLRRGWSKETAGACLSEDGQWARSPEHAEAFMFSDAGALLPYIRRDRHQNNPALIDVDGLPGCPTCSFAPLCDSYWSASFDVLRRTGHEQRAMRVAAFQCALRKDVLTSLLLEIRNSCKASHGGKTRAAFSNGVLSLGRNRES